MASPASVDGDERYQWSYTPRARPLTLTQTPEGFAALQTQLQATIVAPEETLMVMEATGSYWIALAVSLHAAGYHI